MQIYVRCRIETDGYEIDDFKLGAVVMVSPNGAQPFVSCNVEIASVDKLSNQITVKSKSRFEKE